MNSPLRRRRRGAAAGIGVVLLIVIALTVLVVSVGSVLARLDADRAEGGGTTPLTPADVATGTPVAQPAPVAEGTDLAVWAETTSEQTGVPARALIAYALAEQRQRVATPGCALSWSTLAGIGRVESVHGSINGSELTEDGTVEPSIIGIPLDGTRGTQQIADTDGGAFDGDTTYDRAVGPLQFLPSTWGRYGADGNGDGVRDPQQIDDAAAAAAAYLCDGGRDTASGPGWWDGVLTYNRSGEYARLVWAAADRYATAVDVTG